MGVNKHRGLPIEHIHVSRRVKWLMGFMTIPMADQNGCGTLGRALASYTEQP